MKLIYLFYQLFTVALVFVSAMPIEQSLRFLLVGAVAGAFFKMFYDLSTGAKVNRLFFEYIAGIVFVGGTGLFAVELINYYFDLEGKIQQGKMSLSFVLALQLGLGFAFVAGGRKGIDYVVKTFMSFVNIYIAQRKKKR